MKPGKLSPKLKAAADVIYESNPVRYNKLILFIQKQKKLGQTDEFLTECLNEAAVNIHWAENWWAYLQSVVLLHPLEKRRENIQRVKDLIGGIGWTHTILEPRKKKI